VTTPVRTAIDLATRLGPAQLELTYHSTPSQQARDRIRQTLITAGFTPLRFTHAQVRYESGYVSETLTSLVSRFERPPAA
jgi:hypothetical protein